VHADERAKTDRLLWFFEKNGGAKSFPTLCETKGEHRIYSFVQIGITKAPANRELLFIAC
jgi:hypothetical protein